VKTNELEVSRNLMSEILQGKMQRMRVKREAII